MTRKFLPSVKRIAPVALVAMLVLSAVATPGLAQTTDTETATDSGPVTLEFTGGDEILVVDTTDMSGSVTVSYHTQGTPGSGSQVLVEETIDTTATDGVALANLGAYDSVNATVEGTGTPTTATYGGRLDMPDSYTMLGGTGGDADLQCGVMEHIGKAVDSSFTQLDCVAQPGTLTVDTTGTDASQTKLDLHQSALNSDAQAQSYETTLDNYLSDTKTQARIIGKNAYIRALNNGSTKAASKTAAKSAVSEYYATKQRNLINSWNQKLAHGDYMKSVASNESGISTLYAGDGNHSVTYTGGPVSVDSVSYNAGTTSVTLANGDTMQATQASVTMYAEASDGSWSSTDTQTYGPLTHDQAHVFDSSSNFDGKSHGIAIQSDSTDTTRFEFVDFGDTAVRFNEIQSQRDTVHTDLDTLAENTYSAYQQGEINNTDLVDPYVLSSQQSPGSDFQGWTAAQLTLLGTNSPENFDQIGSFNITASDGTQYEGVLFSQENPTSGEFAAGNTYDASTLGGTQYVVTSDRIVELTGSFTVDDIKDQSGEKVQNVTIQKTQYTTTSTTELKALYDDLAQKRAEIEAREQNMLNSGGGALLGGSSMYVGIGVLALAGLLLASRKDGGRY